MSEDINVDEIFGAEDEPVEVTLGSAEAVEEEIEVEAEEPEEAPQLSELQLEARGMGHTSKEEWTASGKDPERWKTAHEFVSFGHIKQQMDKQKADFDSRLEGVNKLHDAQVAAKVKELEALKRTAVSEADTKGYDSAQQQIDDLNKLEVETPNQTGKDPAIAAWEAKNTWIDDNTKTVNVNGVEIPKASIANTLFSTFNASNPHATPQQALDYIDKEMAKVSGPAANPRREGVTATERPTPQSKAPKKLSMNDLTPDERQSWNAFGYDLFGNDKAAFLQSVKDSRGK